MTELKTSPEQIAAWLRGSFSDQLIEIVPQHDRLLYLFRVLDRQRPPFPTLCVAQEVLEGHSFSEIVDSFERHHLVRQLNDRPSGRITCLALNRFQSQMES